VSEVNIVLTEHDLEIIESGSPVYLTSGGVGVRVFLTVQARQLVHEALAHRAKRKTRKGRKPRVTP
jgi:hypothetical protein